MKRLFLCLCYIWSCFSCRTQFPPSDTGTMCLEINRQLINTRFDHYADRHNSAIIDLAIIKSLGEDFVDQWLTKDERVFFKIKINQYGSVESLYCMGEQSTFDRHDLSRVEKYIHDNDIKFTLPLKISGDLDATNDSSIIEEGIEYIREKYFRNQVDLVISVEAPWPFYMNFDRSKIIKTKSYRLYVYDEFINMYSAPTSREILASRGVKVISPEKGISNNSSNEVYYDTELLDEYDKYVLESYFVSDWADSLMLAKINVRLARKYLERYKRDDFFKQMCYRRALELDPMYNASFKKRNR